ncbi:hypothetical protein QSE00_24720 [Arenibacter sp. M-2]|uniref:hypothetical protein n=1 Tax=Arenibacter sp. M-2 TaxID=3053612 RepID=UPI002570D178|nr:hypothetical protein [Arenibacter sp. M-2]MDL5515037.1 hypothetical protein [Arenibacter sp. M-2]
MKYGLGLFVLTLLCCSQDDTKSLTSSNLKGKWIETVTRMDNLDVMNLNRGKELKNGNLLPKPKSGPYRYELLEHRISLNRVLSSDSSFKDYYLRLTNNKLYIENFYGSTLGETLTFERLD